MKKSLAPPAESLSSLMTRAPELYDRVSQLLEEGHSPAGVSALTGVDIRTVRLVRETIADAIHAAIRKTGYDLIETIQRFSERLLAEADRIPAEKLPQALALLLDKSLLLNGAPTSRVEFAHVKAPSRERLLEMYRELSKKADAVEVTRNGDL